MAANNMILVLLCVTVMGLIFLAILYMAQMAFINSIILNSFSPKFAGLFKITGSANETTDHHVIPQNLYIMIDSSRFWYL